VVFALQFAAGMRFGELAGLHIEDLDFENSIIHIRRSTFRAIETSPKTDAGYRDVNVNPEVMIMLRKHIKDRKSGRIFMNRKGGPLVHGNVNRYVLKPVCRELKIPIGTTHAFRHGRVSVLMQNQVPSLLIKEWVGHTSLKTTEKYGHFAGAYKQKVASELKS
jgi:integrase